MILVYIVKIARKLLTKLVSASLFSMKSVRCIVIEDNAFGINVERQAVCMRANYCALTTCSSYFMALI